MLTKKVQVAKFLLYNTFSNTFSRWIWIFSCLLCLFTYNIISIITIVNYSTFVMFFCVSCLFRIWSSIFFIWKVNLFEKFEKLKLKIKIKNYHHFFLFYLALFSLDWFICEALEVLFATGTGIKFRNIFMDLIVIFYFIFLQRNVFNVFGKM